MKNIYELGYRILAFLFILTFFVQSCRNQRGPGHTEDQPGEGTENVELISEQDGIEPILLKRAKEGNPKAQFKLGKKYFNLWERKHSQKYFIEAERWLRKAAYEGYGKAIDLLNKLNEIEDENEANVIYEENEDKRTIFLINLIKRAVENDIDARYQLGKGLYEAYENNVNPKQEWRIRAIEWLTKAASQGHEEAIVMLRKIHGEKKKRDKREKEKKEKEKKEKEELIIPLDFLDILEEIPLEILGNILPYLSAKDILTMRTFNRRLYTLITGQEPSTDSIINNVGLTNKPTFLPDTNNWVLERVIDFNKDRLLKELTIQTMPTFYFYQLMGNVKNLPEQFWPYIKGSNIHTIDLSANNITLEEAVEFVKSLQYARNVHTIDLSNNNLKNEGVKAVIQALINTNNTSVHTINLKFNNIKAKQVGEIAKSLQYTNIQRVDLSWNKLGPEGAVQFVENLKDSQVQELNLSFNDIIGPSAIKRIAKGLVDTNVTNVILFGNAVPDSIVAEIIKEYPHISWKFRTKSS